VTCVDPDGTRPEHTRPEETRPDESSAIRRLEIIEAVRVTKARYFRFIDQKRWDEFPSLFVADVHVDVTDDMRLSGLDPSRGITTGADQFARNVSRALDGVHTVHHGHMQEIDVVDDAHAHAITAMFDRLQFPDGRVQVGYGHYEEEYRLDDGAWRIARMTLRRLHVGDGL
jgi:SnoaL-like domain